MEKTMDKIVQVAKARGFVYPGSEIYGGLANTWDYGNLFQNHDGLRRPISRNHHESHQKLNNP